jgi:hypothetical protein
LTYTRETAELLLPTIWDQDSIYGVQRENTPDPDMPSGYKNPAHGNNLPAFLIDIKDAWHAAPLSLKERRAVLLRFGVDMKQTEIAAHEGGTKSLITTRLFTAIGKIVAQMNGTDFKEEMD